jgi:hypothetical protein
MRLALPSLLALICVACGSTGGTGGTCVPGASDACFCTDGRMGAQTCQSDRTFDACVCTGSAAGGGAGGGTGGGSGGGTGGGDAGTSDGGVPAKRVFVTFNVYTGDLKTQGGGTDGLDGADKLCALAAASVNLGGQWKAWLSTSSVNAIDRIAEVGPWLNLAKQVVFFNKATVKSGALVPIRYSERAHDITSGGPTSATWTGTNGDGVRSQPGTADRTCLDWTIGTVDISAPPSSWNQAQDGSGLSAGKLWTEFGIHHCDDKHRLVCFEQ